MWRQRPRFSTQSLTEAPVVDIDAICHPPCKTSGIIKFPCSEIGFCPHCPFVRVYLWTSRKPECRMADKRGFAHTQGCAHRNPIEFPWDARSYGLEIFQTSLPLGDDVISSGWSRKMKWSAYTSAKPLTPDAAGTIATMWKHMFPTLQINPRMCFFSPRLYRARIRI